VPAIRSANAAAAGELNSRSSPATPYRAEGCNHSAAERLPAGAPRAHRLAPMVVISSWSITDKPQGRFDAARELVAVWAVHLHRSYRLIRGA
jgi:hypothetical protein